MLLFIQLGKQLGDGRAIGNLGWRVVDLYFNGDPLPFYSIALFDRTIRSQRFELYPRPREPSAQPAH
jgi:hypothetical protein